MYRDEYTRQAKKDARIVRQNGFKDKADEIIKIIRRNPYEDTPGHFFEELKGNLKGRYSRRLNYHNRFTYEVLDNTEKQKDDNGVEYEGIVNVLTMWGHYPP